MADPGEARPLTRKTPKTPWWTKVLRFRPVAGGGFRVETPWYRETYVNVTLLETLARSVEWPQVTADSVVFDCVNGYAEYDIVHDGDTPREFSDMVKLKLRKGRRTR